MIFRFFRKIDWIIFAGMVLLIFIQVFLELEIPGYMSEITRIMTTGGTGQEVWDQGIWMLACAFGSLLVSLFAVAAMSYIGTNLGKTLRERQFAHVQRFSDVEMDKFPIPSLITRSTNDVTQVQFFVTMGLLIIIRAPIMAVWAIMKISTQNQEWTLATAVTLLLMSLSAVVILWFAYPRFKKIQWLNDDVNRITRESIMGIRVVHAYNAESYQADKFVEANKKLTGTYLSVTRAMSFVSPLLTGFLSMLSLAIYWIGAVLINSTPDPMERIDDFSAMVVFSSYAMQVIAAFMMVVAVLVVLPRALVAIRRVEAVIDVEPSIKDGPVTVSPEGSEGEISFRNVSFKYPGGSQNVLTDISFDVSKGETVAIIGSTGSGKTTLVKMLPRFYDVTEGQVLVDGVDVREYRLDCLNSKIGYVPQKISMFTGTIESNVNYGDTKEDRTQEDVRKAIAIAQGTEFVEGMEGQYQAAVSEGGTNLSGGQKQRISIARAVCKRPEIYVFDDSFSALDYRTDSKLRSELKAETAGVTTIIVAQRIGTIMNADKIIVLDEGRIVGIGKHEELLKSCDVYHEIALSQLSEKELMA